MSNIAHIEKQLTVLPNKIGGNPFKMGQSRSGKARPRRGVPNLDPNGQSLKNEAEAIAKAKVMAIGVSLDKPEVDPMLRIVIRDDGGQEIFNEPVYSTPMAR